MNPFLGILFGLLSMLGYGLSNAIAKVPSGKIGSVRTVFYRNIFVSLFLFIILLFTDFTLSPLYIILALIISLIGYIPLLFFYKALSVGKVGIVSPVANSSVIWTILLSIIFFKESLTATQVLAMLFIITGIFLVSVNFRDLRNSSLFTLSSGVPYAIITSLLWGLTFFLFKIPVNILGPFLTSFIIELGIAIYSGIHLYTSQKSLAIKEKSMLPYLISIALFGTAGTLFFNLGISLYSVSIVSALTFSSPWIAALYGKIVYKEKLSIMQYMAIAFVVLGLVVISL
ncbi:MAG TPA: EamA family transporter [Candidatus Nanoarchaeia archaeon]|nr:EamA family transporter [Candidatus Nanoarchaeia archaeon]